MRIAVLRQPVDPRPAGIAQAEQLGYFVEGLARRVVQRLAHVAIVPDADAFFRKVQMRVPAGDDQRQQRSGNGVMLLARLQQHGMDVTFQVVDRNQGLVERKGQPFGVQDADQQRARQSWAFSYGDGIKLVERDAGLFERGAHHGDDILQMLPRGQLRHHAAIARMGAYLRCHHIGQHARTRLDHGCRGLVAGAFNAENQARLCAVLRSC